MNGKCAICCTVAVVLGGIVALALAMFVLMPLLSTLNFGPLQAEQCEAEAVTRGDWLSDEKPFIHIRAKVRLKNATASRLGVVIAGRYTRPKLLIRHKLAGRCAQGGFTGLPFVSADDWNRQSDRDMARSRALYLEKGQATDVTLVLSICKVPEEVYEKVRNAGRMPLGQGFAELEVVAITEEKFQPVFIRCGF